MILASTATQQAKISGLSGLDGLVGLGGHTRHLVLVVGIMICAWCVPNSRWGGSFLAEKKRPGEVQRHVFGLHSHISGWNF